MEVEAIRYEAGGERSTDPFVDSGSGRRARPGPVASPGAFLCALLALGVAACASVRSMDPAVRDLYSDAAKREARNPVVVIHGTLGARLVERATGKVVWGAFTRDAIDVQTPEGARAMAVGLPGEGGAMAYDQDTAAVYPTGPVGAIDVGLFFGVVSVDVYSRILRALGVGGYSDVVYTGPEYADDHFTCHTFFYDWRRDNVENAIALDRFLAETRAQIDASARRKIARLRAEGTQDALRRATELDGWLREGWRFDVVAHSMGGLIARYYLRYGARDLPLDGSTPEVTWAGSAQIDRLVLVATPSLGAMDALHQLLEGFDLGLFLPTYHQAILGTMPSTYQLLPRNGNRLLRDEAGGPVDLDLFDPDVWDREGWGILDPASAEILGWLLPDVADPRERRRRAKDYLSWCLGRARRFQAALDADPETPCPAEVRLFAADGLPTPAMGVVRRDAAGRAHIRFGGAGTMAFGDGTVPRFSAVADRSYGRGEPSAWVDSPVPWSSVTFLPDDHIGLTANPVFTDNLLFFLLQQRPTRSTDP